MKKKLLLLFACLVAAVALVGLLSVSSSAATEGYYTYEVSNGEATITAADNAISGDVIIPSTLGGYSVTMIDDSAFLGCKNLTSVTIPDSVISIGPHAFAWDENITSVTIPESVTYIGGLAFHDCTSLTSISLPEGLTCIQDGTFEYSGLTSVIIPESVTSVGEDAFWACEDLKTVYFRGTEAEWNAISFENEWADPTYYGATVVCSRTVTKGDFTYTVKIDRVELTRVNMFATGEIVIPATFEGLPVVAIADGAFADCDVVESVVIPRSVTKIGASAFSNCFGITSITIPDTVTSIGEGAFDGCNALETVHYRYHESAENWNKIAFGNQTADPTYSGATLFSAIAKYTYTFLDEDGVTVLKQETVDYGTAILAPVKAKAPTPQYTYTPVFNGFEEGMTVKEDITFTFCGFDATVNQYTYTFLNEDGTLLKELTADYGTQIIAPEDPQKQAVEGYVFAFAGFEGFLDGMLLTQDISFRATYKAIEDTLKIKSAYLELSKDIGVIYTAEVSELYTSPYMVFTFRGENYTVYGKHTKDDLYTFIFKGVLPQYMGDNIKATLYASCEFGTVTDTVESYSVRQYCVNQLSKTTNEKLITLLSDLLVYGAKAQLYRNYNVDDLVTEEIAKLAPSTFETLGREASKKSTAGTRDENAYWQSTGLVYENAMAMYVKFFAKDAENLMVKIAVGEKVTTYLVKDLEEKDGVYTLTFRNILATEFDMTVTANFYRDGVLTGQTMTYSVNSYVYTAQNSADTALAELMKATYNYGASASAYVK